MIVIIYFFIVALIFAIGAETIAGGVAIGGALILIFLAIWPSKEDRRDDRIRESLRKARARAMGWPD